MSSPAMDGLSLQSRSDGPVDSQRKKVRLMRDISVGRKLGIMAATMIVPIITLMVVYGHTLKSTIDVAKTEEQGLVIVDKLPELASAIGDHETAISTVLLGNQAAGEQVRQAVQAGDKIVAELDAQSDNFVNAERLDAWKAARATWDSLKSASFTSTGENTEAHRKAFDAIFALKDKVIDDSGIALDPAPGTYYALDVATAKLPDLTRLFNDARAIAIAVQGTGTPSTIQRRALIAQAGIIEDRLEAIKTELAQVRDSLKDEPASLDYVTKISNNWDDDTTDWLALFSTTMLNPAVTVDNMKDILQKGQPLPAQLAAVQTSASQAASSALQTRIKHDTRTMWITMVSSTIAILFAIWLVYAISSRIAGAIKRLREIAIHIAQGDYTNLIDTRGSDELSGLFDSVNTMQVQLQREQVQRDTAVSEITRLKGALDSAATNVMVADLNNNIVYMNNGVSKFFVEREQSLRADLPNFDARKLIGANMDLFHRNPNHQRNMLSSLRSTHRGQMLIGGQSIVVVANPIYNDSGERTGTVVEWTDRTAEVAAEKEVADLVKAVYSGDLSVRVSEEGKTGFFSIMASGLNALVASVSGVVEEVRNLVVAANAGDLAARMRFEGKPGLNRTLGEGINELVDEVGSVVDELQSLVTSANSGDLTARMPVEGRSGLFQKVGTGVNDLVENMADVISQVKEAASEVHRGADEISQGNTNLSQRTEEQASSLEQTASSMEQMTSTVKQNADNAGQANQLAVAARDQAEKGGAVVARAVRAMSDINDASKRIADIIGVIDEIAFQTNLLALNAAVEAARAGEQGRGFAVVATEVRNLAGRSATAAKEIKGLIQDSVRKVDEGSSLVTQSGATLEQIVSAVKKVTDIVAEIAAASQEQSSGIDQVNKAVMQLDELTQQNAALVEEASAASQAMAEQARSLNDAMGRYTVSDGAAMKAGPPARAVSAGEHGVLAPRAGRPPASRPHAVKTVTKAARPAARRVSGPAIAQVEATGRNDAVWKEF